MQAGRVLRSKAALTLPLALRQEAETWHSRQEERRGHAQTWTVYDSIPTDFISACLYVHHQSLSYECMRCYAHFSARPIYLRNNRSLETPKATVFEKDVADDRLNLAKSMEAVVERAANLEEAAGWEAARGCPGFLLLCLSSVCLFMLRLLTFEELPVTTFLTSA